MDTARQLRALIDAYDATVRLEPGAEDRLVRAICDGRAAIREVRVGFDGGKPGDETALAIRGGLMKRLCPDCNGSGKGCLTCNGSGEWTCPFCGFREGQKCEQSGADVPCFDIKDLAAIVESNDRSEKNEAAREAQERQWREGMDRWTR